MKSRIRNALLVFGVVLLFAVLCLYFEGKKQVEDFYAAAEKGDAAHQNSLGVYFYQGKLFPKDYTKAIEWFKKAANQGFADAQFNLGHMYWFAEGVPPDLTQAYVWISLAANQGYKKASDNLPILKKSMTPDQIAEAEKLVSEWKPTAKP